MLTEAMCEGEHCLIVGSAPNVKLPEGDFGCVIGANGGVAIARQLGLDVDVLVTTSHLFREGEISPTEKWTIDIMRDSTVDHVWADTKNGPLELVVKGCEENYISYLDIFGVDPDERNEVVREATNRDIWVSSGVWAICLAHASGASKISIAGISLTNGHHNIDDNAPRFHISQDRLCLDTLRARSIIW